jgi:hypothetical protein
MLGAVPIAIYLRLRERFSARWVGFAAAAQLKPNVLDTNIPQFKAPPAKAHINSLEFCGSSFGAKS